MKTVVIFGGSGYIGQNIICHLAQNRYRIIVPYQKRINEAKLRFFGNVGQIVPIKFEGLAESDIYNAINSSDIIINLKTIWQENKKFSYEKHILNFNIQLVDLINSLNKEKKLIFFSGLGVNAQSLSKRTQFIAKVEQYIHKNIKNSLIIRPGIVIGENDKFLSKLISIFKISYFIPLFGSGNAKFQPVFINDISKAISQIIEKNQMNNVYELGGNEFFTYKEFYYYILDCLNLRRLIVPIPFLFMQFVVSVMEKIGLNLITKDQLLLFKEDNIVTNLEKNFGDLDIFPKNIKYIVNNIIKKN